MIIINLIFNKSKKNVKPIISKSISPYKPKSVSDRSVYNGIVNPVVSRRFNCVKLETEETFESSMGDKKISHLLFF